MSTPEETAEKVHKALLDQMVNEYLDVSEAMDKYAERKKQVANEIASMLGPGGRHEVVPGVGVMVTAAPRRFDPKLAAEILNPTQYAAICTQVPSSDLAAKMLPGALVDQLKVAGDRPVVRRLS